MARRLGEANFGIKKDTKIMDLLAWLGPGNSRNTVPNDPANFSIITLAASRIVCRHDSCDLIRWP